MLASPPLSHAQVDMDDLAAARKAAELHAQAAAANEPGWLASMGPAAKTVAQFFLSVPTRVKNLGAMSRAEWRTMLHGWWVIIKKEAHHYWVGTKLLWAEIQAIPRRHPGSPHAAPLRLPCSAPALSMLATPAELLAACGVTVTVGPSHCR